MSNLPEQDREQLIAAALEAQRHAYTPYACFPVGAAVLTTKGQVFAGCNVENASYGLTICAERVAIAAAVAAGARTFAALAIAAAAGAPPCGACRQFMAEFCNDLPILQIDSDGDREIAETSLAALLPNSFRLE